MRLYLQCPNCKIYNKIHTESKEVKEDRLTCRNCGRLYCIKTDPKTGDPYLDPLGDGMQCGECQTTKENNEH